jgi:hypothetical protein
MVVEAWVPRGRPRARRRPRWGTRPSDAQGGRRRRQRHHRGLRPRHRRVMTPGTLGDELRTRTRQRRRGGRAIILLRVAKMTRPTKDFSTGRENGRRSDHSLRPPVYSAIYATGSGNHKGLAGPAPGMTYTVAGRSCSMSRWVAIFFGLARPHEPADRWGLCSGQARGALMACLGGRRWWPPRRCGAGRRSRC